VGTAYAKDGRSIGMNSTTGSSPVASNPGRFDLDSHGSAQRQPMSLDELTDFELAELGEALAGELRRRALDRFDPAALADEAFTLFDSRGNAPNPALAGGLLICSGSLKGRPGGHHCSFTTVNGESWVWDHEHLFDEMRWASEEQLFTVTVLIALPRMLVTQVDSVAGNAGHKRKSTSSWLVRGDRLEPTATPSRVPDDHRR
jgi:hypothetical protein